MKYNLECALWEITLRCNLKCFHCEFSAGNALPDELSTQEALGLCEALDNIQCKRVVLLGGEPFLRNDWDIIAKKIKDLGMELGFISNGYLDNEKIFLKLKNQNLLQQVVFSLSINLSLLWNILGYLNFL